MYNFLESVPVVNKRKYSKKQTGIVKEYSIPLTNLEIEEGEIFVRAKTLRDTYYSPVDPDIITIINDYSGDIHAVGVIYDNTLTIVQNLFRLAFFKNLLTEYEFSVWLDTNITTMPLFKDMGIDRLKTLISAKMEMPGFKEDCDGIIKKINAYFERHRDEVAV